MNRHHIYDRVYLLGVDGAGSFFTKTDTPNIDRIFADGAVNHNTLTAVPTISAQCWGAMLHGVSPSAHRLTNGLVSATPLPADFPYPSIFRVVRESFPNAGLSSVSNWNAINVGIIEDNLSVHKETGSDEEVCEKTIKTIINDNPKLLFVQFDSVDGAGHRFGYGTQGHLKQITYVDTLIGKIFDAAEKAGRMENTLLIVTADHGGTPAGGHGGPTDAEKRVSFYVRGDSVCRGTFGETDIRDTTAIIAFALGIAPSGAWSARIPDGLFTDGISYDRPSEYREKGKKRYSDRPHKDVPVSPGTVLSDFIDLHDQLLFCPMNGNTDDISGKTTVQTDGKIYFTEGFYGQAATLDDCTLHAGQIDPGEKNYTFCTWIRMPSCPENIRLLLFDTQESENKPGITYYIENGNMKCIICNGTDSETRISPLPVHYENNWFHFMSSLDRNCTELCFYYDFCLDSDWEDMTKIPAGTSLTGVPPVIGNHSPLTVCDMMFFTHKLSDPEIDNMQKYYEQT